MENHLKRICSWDFFSALNGNFHLPCLITAGYLPKSIECACMLWDVIGYNGIYNPISYVAWSRVGHGFIYPFIRIPIL